MFLELSFDSRTGDKDVATSRASRSWRYDHDDEHEMSLDELIGEFHQSTTSHRSQLDESVSRRGASPRQQVSPPKHSKAKESSRRNRVAQQAPGRRKAAPRDIHDDESSGDDGAVMPMPKLERVLRNKPSLVPKFRGPPTTRSKVAMLRSRNPPPPSPAPSSPTLSPASLSPVTSSSAASSPVSKASTPNEDSIDALIGKDIRELNKLIAASSRGSQKNINREKSPSSDEVTQKLRQNTRFGTEKTKRLRPQLQLQISKRVSKARSAMPESPPPPPPPGDDEEFDEDEEDSFAEEIKKLRESRRLNSWLTKAPEKEAPTAEAKQETSEICATAVLKIRDASDAIDGLLLEALKPFQDRQREEEKACATENESPGGDSAIQKAAQAGLQSATQTIVSQLDLTFADMTESRNADLKAEVDAVAAAKDAEKREKEVAEAKKKTAEEGAKAREMEILRLIPMKGKLLTCSKDIEDVLTQLETVDGVLPRELPSSNTFAVETEVKALRNHVQRKMQVIEAHMTEFSSQKPETGQSNVLSWRAIDWGQDNLGVRQVRNDNVDMKNTAKFEADDISTEKDEETLQEILQRNVLEKLDLTMLKLKHVLSVDTKEAAEIQEKMKHEEEERAKELSQQQLEDERNQQAMKDAETARRRVMGLTSLDEVEGWIEEERILHDEFGLGRPLNHLIDSLDNHEGAHNAWTPSSYLRIVHPNQEQALSHFDDLARDTSTDTSAINFPTYDMLEHDLKYGKEYPNKYGQNLQRFRAQQSPRSRQTELSSNTSNCRDSVKIAVGSDEDRYSLVDQYRSSSRDAGRESRSLLSLLSSPPPQYYEKKLYKRRHDEYSLPRACHSENKLCSPSWRKKKRGAGRHQHDVAGTIEALKADRRRKVAWIQSRQPLYRSLHCGTTHL
ncbi:unnamed protein product [Phytophthora fragariaefolia]|uniref:Unnamed protein product n=1 Tax=Phytophthora fragariaefolia TaxID=1490495 RepID=A0A9W7CSZ8_9STRA|nr:unnamed protein product [Phytophthora fragariaefolia]